MGLLRNSDYYSQGSTLDRLFRVLYEQRRDVIRWANSIMSIQPPSFRFRSYIRQPAKLTGYKLTPDVKG